jgi:hypothetical protein
MLKNKKGFIMHPVTWIVAAFIIGVILTYILVAKGIIPSGLLPF